MECTHTSDWWKQMVPCICCGAPYDEQEMVLLLGHDALTAQQLALIERMKAEATHVD